MKKTATVMAAVALTGCSAMAPYDTDDIGERGGYCSNVSTFGIEDTDAYLSAMQAQGYINAMDAETYRESLTEGRMIAQGMTECGVRMIWGRPYDERSYSSQYGERQTLTYEDHGYYSSDYHFIYLRNGKVDSWSLD